MKRLIVVHYARPAPHVMFHERTSSPSFPPSSLLPSPSIHSAKRPDETTMTLLEWMLGAPISSNESHSGDHATFQGNFKQRLRSASAHELTLHLLGQFSPRVS